MGAELPFFLAAARGGRKAMKPVTNVVICAVRPVGAILCLAIAMTGVGTFASASDTVFTVAKYPVEAVAKNAVAAKAKAHADGRDAALRSLLKRLVPVTAYPRLRRLGKLNSSQYLDGISVRSEQNSRTEYIATMDFMFRPAPVKDLLRRQGITFVEEQAQQITLIPVYLPPENNGARPPAGYSLAEGTQGWMDIWRDLDLEHTLTPVRLLPLKKQIHPDSVMRLLKGDGSAYRIFTTEYLSEYVILAVAEPDLGTKRLTVTLIGRDAVGPFRLKRSYRINDDLFYASELSAVIALGVLEGRWKAIMARSGAGLAAGGGVPEPVRFVVTFSGAAQWRDIRTRIARTAGVEQMEVAGMSARGATVSLLYPGGAKQLARGLQAEGLYLRRAGGGWLLQGS